jgi:hypothetical protein
MRGCLARLRVNVGRAFEPASKAFGACRFRGLSSPVFKNGRLESLLYRRQPVTKAGLRTEFLDGPSRRRSVLRTTKTP